MAHIVYTGVACRLEVNLDERDEAAAVEFLLGLVQQRTLARRAPGCDCGLPLPPADQAKVGPLPVSRHTPRVAEPEAAQVTDVAGGTADPPAGQDRSETAPAAAPGGNDSPGAGAVPPPLLPKTCERDGCETVFQPKKQGQRFCSTGCRVAANNANRERSRPGEFACPDCGKTFSTPSGVGGHRGKAHPGAKARAAATASPLTNEARTDATVASHTPAAKVSPPEDRPFRCKEPGCGHPCRSRGELEKHREAYHPGPKQGLPAVTQVLGALTFTCPVDGCGREYDDENRLTHHRRAAHDHERVEPVHQVVVSGHHGEKVG